MGPSKRHMTNVSPNTPAKKHRARVSDSALRQALARRRLEERREAEMLRQQCYDVFSGED